jgi:hypothetical protein
MNARIRIILKAESKRVRFKEAVLFDVIYKNLSLELFLIESDPMLLLE